MVKKEKRVTQFNMSVEEYQRRIALAKQKDQPVGRVPSVKIPHLNAPSVSDGPMSQQAGVINDPTNPSSPEYRMGAKPVTEVLPTEAVTKPGFRPGVGSMFAVNQPHLKGSKVVREGRTQDDIAKDLAMAAEALKEQEKVQKEAMASPKPKPISADPTIKPGMKPLTPEPDPGPLQESLDTTFSKSNLDEFEDLMSDKLNTKERKDFIESRLAPMNLEDLIVQLEVRQKVPITDKLVLEFRSMSGEEDLAIKRLMWGETGGSRYVYDKFMICQATAMLYSVNGHMLPQHLDDSGDWSEELFLKKLKRVLKFPLPFIADISINAVWFEQRVRSLFVDEEGMDHLKNG